MANDTMHMCKNRIDVNRFFKKKILCKKSIIYDCYAYAEPLAEGNHFADGLGPKMADVPDNAPERECFINISVMFFKMYVYFMNNIVAKIFVLLSFTLIGIVMVSKSKNLNKMTQSHQPLVAVILTSMKYGFF